MMNFSKFKVGQVFGNSLTGFGMAQTKSRTVNFLKIPAKLLGINFKKFSPKTIALTLVIIAVIAAGILIALSQFGRSATFTQSITAEFPIGKSFQFPIHRENGAPTTNSMTMNLTTAAKMKNILIQGKPAQARVGKTFLIINLELVNDFPQKLNLTPVDLIRLVDSTGKKFAPDVHNEIVTVEPISVKKTRVGFVVDETSSGFNLQVGEINGPKETISLAF